MEKFADIIIEHVFRTQTSRNNVAKPLTVSTEKLTTFLESMLEKTKIEEAEMAVFTISQNHPDRAAVLSNLGGVLFKR